MNASEFIKEVKNSDICPENFENIYNEFMEYQKLVTDTLAEFHRICEKYNITHQLSFGSLLGAIRDNGQIPWDYDVDVIVPYEEKEKLIEALKSDLSDKYYFYCEDVDPKCRHFSMRITPKGYRSEILHVDVFNLIGSPEDPKEREKFIAEVRKICRNRFYRLVNIREETKGHPKLALKFLWGKIKSYICNLSRDAKRYKQLCSKYSAKNSTICIEADFYAGYYLFSSSIWESKLINTDIGTLRVPVQYDEILKSIYGEYNSYPPLESRLDEVLRHHKKIKYNGRELSDN